MILFTRYDKATGKILSTGFCSEEQLSKQGDNIIYGHYKEDVFYVENGAPIAKPVKPDDDHDWDCIKKKWSLNQQRKDEKAAAQLAAEARQAAIDQHEAEHAFIRELMKSKKNG